MQHAENKNAALADGGAAAGKIPDTGDNIQRERQNASGKTAEKGETSKEAMIAALQYIERGYSVIPCKLNKAPAVRSWMDYKTRIMTPEEFRKYAANPKAALFGVIAGKVSGNLAVLDFDNHNGETCLFEEWKTHLCEMSGGGELFSKLYIEKSQSGGRHVAFHLETVPEQEKNIVKSEKEEKRGGIEFIGEGHYAIFAPSPGYEIIQGSPADFPRLSEAEWKMLYSAAVQCRLIDLEEDAGRGEHEKDKGGWKKTPRDAYNERQDALDTMREQLIKADWTLCKEKVTVPVKGSRERTPGEHWTRPGKENGNSATLILSTPPKLRVFTTDAPPFEAGRSYTPFGVYAMAEHDGDFRAATKALIAAGYGEKGEEKQTGTNELTKRFLARFDEGRTVNGGHCLKIHNGDFYEFKGHWKKTSPEAVDAAINGFLWDAGIDVTTSRTKNIKNALLNPYLCHIPDGAAPPYHIPSGKSLDPREIIPVSNGIIKIPDDAERLEDLQLEPATEEIFTRAHLPVKFDPGKKAPTFNAYLHTVLPDPEDRGTVRRMLGYALTPDRSRQVFFVLYGPPGSGKSVIIETIKALFGTELYSTCAYEELGDTFSLANMEGKLVNTAAEIRFDKNAEERVKQIAEGSSMEINEKYKRRYTGRIKALMIFATNNMPKFSNGNDGCLRRIRIIPFDHVIPDKDKDYTLPEMIRRNEMSGVLNFALSGLLELRKPDADFPISKRAEELLGVIRETSDPFLEAIRDITTKEKGGIVRASELYAALRSYFRGHNHSGYAGYSDCKMSIGVERVLGKDAKARKADGACYRGIQLKTDLIFS